MTSNQQRIHLWIWLVLLAGALASAIWFIGYRHEYQSRARSDSQTNTLSP